MFSDWARSALVGALVAVTITGCSGSRTTPQAAQAQVVRLLEQRRPDEAARQAFAAAKEHPEDAKTQFYLGLSLFAKGDVDGAIQAYQKAIELNPNYVEAMNNLGNAYREAGNYREAERAYRQAMATRPDFSLPVEQLAIMLEQIGKVPAAVKVLEEGTQRIPENLDLRAQLGLMYEAAEQVEKAKEIYRQVLDKLPNHELAKGRMAALEAK